MWVWPWVGKNARKFFHVGSAFLKALRGPPSHSGARMAKKPPVVVILGSTATGKSKLAIELAKKYGGEVISADSMQVYKELDILTNKVTEEEMQGVPHYMIGVVDRKEKFDVVHFRDQALPLVEKILEKGKIPFIVGGTNYYIESILWQILIADHTKCENGAEVNWRKRKTDDNANNNEEEGLDSDTLQNPIVALMNSRKGGDDADLTPWSNMELHSALLLVDPDRANRLHPNERRKIIRSLAIRFQTGQCHSHLIAQQSKSRPLGTDGTEVDTPVLVNQVIGGPLRFPHCLCLWIQADKEILLQRIVARTNSMVQLGLKQELDSYMDILLAENSSLDYEQGILQSIGFKEFHSYLQLPVEERDTEVGEKRFKEGLERLNIVTRQYARSQLKWVRRRFLIPQRRQVPPVYRLDGNLVDAENWDNNVYSPAVQILDAYLNNDLDNPLLKEKRVVETDDINDDLISRTCDICDNRIFLGNVQWNAHMKSERHRRMLHKKREIESSNTFRSEESKIELTS